MILSTIKSSTIHLIHVIFNDNTNIYFTFTSKFNLTAQQKQSEFYIEH